MSLTTKSSTTREIARFVAEDHHLGPELEDWMRLLYMDYAAVTLGGVDRESAKVISSAIPTLEAASRENPAFVAGGKWATVENAALINGTIAHGLELDDTFEEGSLHPAVVVFPAVVAVAESRRITFREMFRAAAVGYEVMCKVAVLVGAEESYGRGFHPTGISGSVGAAAAVANLLEFDESTALNAIAIGANIATGSLEFLSDGSWTKRLNAGQAAANGIRAAQLAEKGFIGPETAIEGRLGFLHQYGRGEREDRHFELCLGEAAMNTSIKFYPCCRYMHGNIDLLREIHNENEGLDVSKIERIEAAVIHAGASLVSEPASKKLNVETPVDAQFNMPFGAALAIATGNAVVSDFDHAPETAKSLQSLMEKVHCYTDDEIEAAYPKEWQARVKVTMKDGTEFEKFEDAYIGSAKKRATWEQIEEKARGLIGESSASTLRAHAKTVDSDETVDFAAAC